MKQYKAIIFDMDGTLVNTERLWKNAETELLASYGRVYDSVIHSEFIGMAVDDFIPAVQHAYDLTHIDTKDMIYELDNSVLKLLEEQAQPTLGAIELVNHIVDNDIPVAIASNSSHEIIQATLCHQHWANPIIERYSAEDVQNAKPAPDLYLHVADQLAIEPQDCIAVEDSLNGVKAAITAGMRCLAVPDFELSDVDAFKAVTPYIFELLTEVLPLIQQNM